MSFVLVIVIDDAVPKFTPLRHATHDTDARACDVVGECVTAIANVHS